uniref:Angiopoietin-related protein 4-like n=1 Tax=Gouania willdenowi TaxID=441366 RepID=A0A8C5D073_GOUWI
MKTPQLLLLLVTILVHVASAFPSDRRGKEKYASWDDVNVVAHGLLQLGQGLKEHVDKTKAQMRDVNAKFKAFNGSVVELERVQQEQREALRTEKEESERRAAELAQEVKVKVEEVQKHTDDIQSRMERLEGLLTNTETFSFFFRFQRLVAAQSRRIDQLVEKIKQQQDKLEKQSLHLQALVKSHRRRDEETALRGETEPIHDREGLAKDCHELFVRGQRLSGVYTIQPESSHPFDVLCEMTSDGAWTIIQKRHDGSQNFNQKWDEYKNGFGSLNGEFWLGLEKIHSLSKQGPSYQFHLDGEEQKFALHLQKASPSLLQEKMAAGIPFSTSDRDNDLAADTNCAAMHSGGWWFSGCGESNLNGRYPRRKHQTRRQSKSMFWLSMEGQRSSLRTSVLKIAPKSHQ